MKLLLCRPLRRRGEDTKPHPTQTSTPDRGEVSVSRHSCFTHSTESMQGLGARVEALEMKAPVSTAGDGITIFQSPSPRQNDRLCYLSALLRNIYFNCINLIKISVPNNGNFGSITQLLICLQPHCKVAFVQNVKCSQIKEISINFTSV